MNDRDSFFLPTQAIADINEVATGPKADYIVANVGVRNSYDINPGSFAF